VRAKREQKFACRLPESLLIVQSGNENREVFSEIQWWKGLDSNQCTLSRADLQSALGA
jgi:hypothetical protein